MNELIKKVHRNERGRSATAGLRCEMQLMRQRRLAAATGYAQRKTTNHMLRGLRNRNDYGRHDRKTTARWNVESHLPYRDNLRLGSRR